MASSSGCPTFPRTRQQDKEGNQGDSISPLDKERMGRIPDGLHVDRFKGMLYLGSSTPYHELANWSVELDDWSTDPGSPPRTTIQPDPADDRIYLGYFEEERTIRSLRTFLVDGVEHLRDLDAPLAYSKSCCWARSISLCPASRITETFLHGNVFLEVSVRAVFSGCAVVEKSSWLFLFEAQPRLAEITVRDSTVRCQGRILGRKIDASCLSVVLLDSCTAATTEIQCYNMSRVIFNKCRHVVVVDCYEHSDVEGGSARSWERQGRLDEGSTVDIDILSFQRKKKKLHTTGGRM